MSSATRALLFSFVMSCGCGAAEPHVESSAARAATGGGAPPRALEAEVSPPVCRIEAVRAEGVSVSPAGVEPFAVSVSDGALVFVPRGEDDRSLAVQVEHPLRFSASARAGEQRLVLGRATELAAGAVHVAAGLPVLGLARSEHGLVAHVQLGRASITPGAIELSVGPLPLACEDVVAEADAEPRVTPALPRAVPGGELRVAATLPLVLRPLRSAPARVEVRARGREAFVPVWVLDRAGDDARVAIAFSDGARVEGWLPFTALREPSAAEAELVDRLTRERAPEPMSLGMLGALEATQPGASSDEYVGLASLRPGSAVYAEPGHGRWAESAEQPLEVRVRWQRGSAYAQLLEVPGMWVPPERAWVQRGDVSLPET